MNVRDEERIHTKSNKQQQTFGREIRAFMVEFSFALPLYASGYSTHRLL
jgi:hypothetical protein